MNELFCDIPAKWVGHCAKCGRDGLKKNMVTLSVRDGGKAQQRVLCNLCPNCMAALLDELGVGMPGR